MPEARASVPSARRGGSGQLTRGARPSSPSIPVALPGGGGGRGRAAIGCAWQADPGPAQVRRARACPCRHLRPAPASGGGDPTRPPRASRTFPRVDLLALASGPGARLRRSDHLVVDDGSTDSQSLVVLAAAPPGLDHILAAQPDWGRRPPPANAGFCADGLGDLVPFRRCQSDRCCSPDALGVPRCHPASAALAARFRPSCADRRATGQLSGACYPVESRSGGVRPEFIARAGISATMRHSGKRIASRGEHRSSYPPARGAVEDQRRRRVCFCGSRCASPKPDPRACPLVLGGSRARPWRQLMPSQRGA